VRSPPRRSDPAERHAGPRVGGRGLRLGPAGHACDRAGYVGRCAPPPPSRAARSRMSSASGRRRPNPVPRDEAIPLGVGVNAAFR